MSLKCLKENVKHEEDKISKILFDYFKYRFVKHIKLDGDCFSYDCKNEQHLYKINFVGRELLIGFYNYTNRFYLFYNNFIIISIYISSDESRERNKKIYKKIFY